MKQNSLLLKTFLFFIVASFSPDFYGLENSNNSKLEFKITNPESKTYFVGETCADAFPMTVETDCDGTNAITFDFAIAGDIDANNENPTCDAFGNYGYFLSFTAPTIGSVIFNFAGAADNIGLEVYDACGGTPVSDCTNNLFDSGDSSDIIGGLTPGNNYVAVIWRDSNNGTADVCITEGPSCPPPTDLDVVNITSNTADLIWIESGIATEWRIEWGPTGFVSGTGTIINNVASNPYTLIGLTQNTTYDFCVQSICSGEISNCINIFSFTTACGVLSPDYIEQFETIIPNCWDEADSGDSTTGPTDLGSGSWVADEFLNTGSDDGAYKINLWQDSKSDWLLSPIFDLTGGPFQVEFDFGIMEFGSSTTAGTLGSDDTVQLLMTNDNGTTWTTLLTYDNTSVVPVSGVHPVVDLAAYSGQIVQFGILGSEGIIDDTEDVDVFVDNFRVGTLTTCPQPSSLTTTNISFTSAEVGWTEEGTATSWNIEYGIEGFTQGTGTVEADVTTNPFMLTGLTPNTSYQFFVQAFCGPSDNSSYTGPFLFTTALLTDFTIDCNEGAITQDYCYDSGGFESPMIFDFTSSDGMPLNLNFNSGFVENMFDQLVVIDSDGSFIVSPEDEFYGNEGDLSGLSYQSTGDTISFYIHSDASVSCVSSSLNLDQEINYTVSCATCINPQATYTTVEDCDNGEQFLIDVDVTNLGDATSLTITNNVNTDSVSVNATGVYQIGPFPFLVDVIVTLSNDQDVSCIINSSGIQLLACSPSNDECIDAITAIVNNELACSQVTSGTILAATSSSEPVGSCDGSPNDDVWFEFTALNETQIISLINVTGGTPNLNHAVYQGSCDSLTELYCSNSESSISPELTIGGTYFIRVFSGGSEAETTAFDLCIREAPNNTICENAAFFCSDETGSTVSNAIDVPSLGSIACLNNSPNPTWSVLQIDGAGDIEVVINQTDDNGNGLDVDFVLWGPFTSVESACNEIVLEDCPTCPNNTTNPDFYPFLNIVDCSYSVAAVENFTIDNAQSGEIYMLLTTNFSNTQGVITITQTNIGEPNAGILSGDFVIDLGPDQNLCDTNAYQIDAASQFADSYSWYLNGFIIPGEESETLTVTQSGNYSVIALNNACTSQAVDDISITFNDCSEVGLIQINAFYDDNMNNVFDTTEASFTNGYFTYEMNNDGVIHTIESSTGSFNIASLDESNTYDINYYFYDEYEDCYDVSVLSFDDVSVLLGESLDIEFPIVDESTCEDISIYLVNQQAPRPGFDHTNYLVIENFGLVTTSGTVEYSLDENLSINSISTNTNYTTTLTANGFSLDFVNLLPSQYIVVYLSLQTSISTNLGELITNTATYTTSTNDMVAENNVSSITEEVIGSYDPNNKMESHGKDIVYDDFIASDEYLYYTIRFQNLGTAEAINVRIEDVLDVQLDEATFHMLRSSHDYVVTRTENNLEWVFNNIYLPAEQDDAEGSNGYVYFKIKPKPGYAVADIIPNSAAIYFDFNTPIITNTFNTTFVESLSVNDFESNDFSIYPNPANDKVTVALNNNAIDDFNITLLDIQGKEMRVPRVAYEGVVELNVSSLNAGMYFVQLRNGTNNTIVKKLIIE